MDSYIPRVLKERDKQYFVQNFDKFKFIAVISGK